MASINPNSPVPLYKQVLNILNDQIARQELKFGDKLPSEAELMKQFGVSRITVRAAISELVEDGILERSQGKGTFVALPKVSHPANDNIGFNRSCVLAGKKPSTKLLSIEWVYPSQSQMNFWHLKNDDRIICSKRLRFVDNHPTMIEINHYPASFSYLFDENLTGSLFEILKKHDYNFYVSERTLETCFPTSEESKLLELKPNTPLLLFKDTHKDLLENPSFLSKQLYNTQHLKFYF